jgi:diguanylate cyclase (GGDEF)-like protein
MFHGEGTMVENERDRDNARQKTVRGPLISIILTLFFIIFAIVSILVYREFRSFERSFVDKARAFAAITFCTWRWNADHVNVYVERWTPAGNNDSAKIGIDALEKKGARTMVREIADYTRTDGSFTFRIVTFAAPDDQETFERDSLKNFLKYPNERYMFERGQTKITFHYITPLFYDQRTIQPKGFAVQENRVFGGISVRIDATEEYPLFIRRSAVIIGSAAFLFIFLSIFISSLFRKLARRVHRAQDHIRMYGFSDPLTGALNAKSAGDRLNEECVKAKRMHHPLSIILADVDHLKKINDRFGFQSGNRILRSFVSLARTDLRPYDVVGRLSGDEFLLMMPGITESEALVIAERLRGKITLECAMLSGIPGLMEVTASFGVSTFEENSNTPEAVLKRAERALSRAKSDGCNRVGSN